MDHEQTLEARLALMSDEEKQHFKMVVLALLFTCRLKLKVL